MPMTPRITLRALEESLDVSVLIEDLAGALRAAIADGRMTPAERRAADARLRELAREQREAVQWAERADYHVELITGWTRVGGPNERTRRRAGHHGLAGVIEAERAARPEVARDEAA